MASGRGKARIHHYCGQLAGWLVAWLGSDDADYAATELTATITPIVIDTALITMPISINASGP